MPPLTPSSTRGCGAALALITPTRRPASSKGGCGGCGGMPLVDLAGRLLLARCFRARLGLWRRAISPVHLVIGDLFHRQPGGLALGRGLDLRPRAADQLLGAAGGHQDEAELAVHLGCALSGLLFHERFSWMTVTRQTAGSRGRRFAALVKVLEDFLDPASHVLLPVTLLEDDGGQDLARSACVIVDYHIFVAVRATHLPLRHRQAARNVVRIVEAALRQPFLEHPVARRHDEDAMGLRVAGKHPLRTLDVDVHQHVDPALEPRRHLGPRGAVVVVVPLRPLEELVAGDHRLERHGIGEVIVAPVHLAGARPPRGVANREGQSFANRRQAAAEQAADERRLAGAGRGGEDEELAALGGGSAHVSPPHSTFWTCSRTCSHSALASSTSRTMAALRHLAPRVLSSRKISWVRKSSRLPVAPASPATARKWLAWERSRSISSLTSPRSASSAISCATRDSSSGWPASSSETRRRNAAALSSRAGPRSASSRPTVASSAASRSPSA